MRKCAVRGSRLERFSALDDTNEYDDDSNHEQDMNESAHCVRCDETEQPEYDEDDNDGH